MSKELNIYPFTNGSVVLLTRHIEMLTDGASVPGTQTTSDSEYTSGERPVKVRSSGGQLYPCYAR